MLSTVAFYVLLKYAPGRAVSFSPTLTAMFLVYYYASYYCTVLKEHLENVGESVYMSKWYLLKPNHRRDYLMIMMLGQKERTLTLGPFGFASLERFTEVRSRAL